MTDLQLPVQGTAAEYWQQKHVANPQCAVPRVAQGVISASASQAFRRKTFSLCLLTKGTRNSMEKSLFMRAWLKVNFDELSQWHVVECKLAGFDYFSYRLGLCMGNWVWCALNNK